MKRTALALALILALLISGVSWTGSSRIASANFSPLLSPEVTIVSPSKNGVYSQSNVPLNVKVQMFRYSPSFEFEAVDWLNYSLDGQADVALTTITHQYTQNDTGQIATASGTLSGLSDGMHMLFVHGETTFKKYFDTHFSASVYFTVDTVRPSITVLSPVAFQTYTLTNVTLSYVVSEPVSWAGYSLDQKANVTSRMNTTLTDLPIGTHVLKVYANDSAGNEGASKSIVFTVKDIVPPSILIQSIENNSVFDTADVPLNFTVNEPATWIEYSLDNHVNVTITGKITLIALSDGFHNLTIYANDTSGNIGASETIYFTIKTQQSEPFPTWIVATIAIIAIGVATFLVYFRKIKKTTGKVE